MLCVFFRRCVSGNPPNCFGVFFFTVLLFLGSLGGVFWDELLRRSVGGAYPLSFACYLGGNAVRFSAARFSGDLGYVFKSSPRRYFFGHCWGKFSGANLYWERFIGRCRGFLYGKSLQLLPEKPRGKKFSFA